MDNDVSWEMILNIVKDWNSGLCLSNVYPEIVDDDNEDADDLDDDLENNTFTEYLR